VVEGQGGQREGGVRASGQYIDGVYVLEEV